MAAFREESQSQFREVGVTTSLVVAVPFRDCLPPSHQQIGCCCCCCSSLSFRCFSPSPLFQVLSRRRMSPGHGRSRQCHSHAPAPLLSLFFSRDASSSSSLSGDERPLPLPPPLFFFLLPLFLPGCLLALQRPSAQRKEPLRGRGGRERPSTSSPSCSFLSLGSAATTRGRTFKGAATLLLQEAVGEDFPGKSEGGVRSPSLFNRPRRSPTSNI